jgi:hypothetical protein
MVNLGLASPLIIATSLLYCLRPNFKPMLTSGALVVFHPKSAYFDFKKKYYIYSTKSPFEFHSERNKIIKF